MKLSISLSEEDVRVLDQYVGAASLGSRSAAIQKLIRSLGDPGLREEYAAAWDEWEQSEDSALWDSAVADGLTDAAR